MLAAECGASGKAEGYGQPLRPGASAAVGGRGGVVLCAVCFWNVRDSGNSAVDS
jgi:hypothetical protein